MDQRQHLMVPYPGFIGKRFLEDKISVTGGLMTQKRWPFYKQMSPQ